MYLYLGGALTRGQFKVYPVDGSKPERQYTRRWGVRAMALDPWGDVYAADGSVDEGQIIAYTPGGASVLLTINTNAAQALAFDASGNLYEANTVAVNEYAARSTSLLRVIKKDTAGSDAVAIDETGNLYVGRVSSSVEVFPPGTNKPVRTITDGIDVPYVLLVDPQGDLIVGNCRSCFTQGDARGSVAEYAPGGGTPLRKLTQGIDTPVALVLGSGRRLFVANDPFLKKGWIAVYSSDGKLIRTITDGVYGPNALAVDSEGRLYVSNYPCCEKVNRDSVTVYTPDGSRLLRTIRSGVRGPTAVVIGKR